MASRLILLHTDGRHFSCKGDHRLICKSPSISREEATVASQLTSAHTKNTLSFRFSPNFSGITPFSNRKHPLPPYRATIPVFHLIILQCHPDSPGYSFYTLPPSPVSWPAPILSTSQFALIWYVTNTLYRSMSAHQPPCHDPLLTKTLHSHPSQELLPEEPIEDQPATVVKPVPIVKSAPVVKPAPAAPVMSIALAQKTDDPS